MKKTVALLAVLFIFTGCSRLPAPTVPPVTTQATTEAVTVPVTTEVTTEAATETTTETTAEPVATGLYLERVKDPNCEIFAEPDYDSRFVRTVGRPGTFTIIEEKWDYEGNLWGRLKSGLGWINLSENRSAAKQELPITIGLAGEQWSAKGSCIDIQVEWEYAMRVLFYPMETITDVRLYRHNCMDDEPREAPVFETDELSSENPLVAQISFPGDMSAYLIVFTDAQGNTRRFEVCTSGRNATLSFYER